MLGRSLEPSAGGQTPLLISASWPRAKSKNEPEGGADHGRRDRLRYGAENRGPGKSSIFFLAFLSPSFTSSSWIQNMPGPCVIKIFVRRLSVRCFRRWGTADAPCFTSSRMVFEGTGGR